ncbi:MAG: SDR family NAD(P)-dependent oxidoreductase [Bacteroidota bacterium]
MNILLTGGHSGIGLELTRMLLKDGHHLGLIVRSEKRKADAQRELGAQAAIDYFIADLGKRDQITAVAQSISEKWDRIDGLFNNAGVLLDQAYYSDQGNELQFEINALTPYHLTTQLKPLLDAAEKPFVVNTATGSVHKKKELDIAEIRKPKKFVKLTGSYLNSKYALVLLMNHLAKEWPNVRIASVNPGPNKTKMTGKDNSGMPGWLLPFRNLLFPKPIAGAKKLYAAAFAPRFQTQSGIITNGKSVQPMKYALSDAEAKELLAN